VEPSIWVPAAAAVLGAAITALAGKMPRRERAQIERAHVAREAIFGNSNGNGGLVRAILDDRARVDEDHEHELNELRSEHERELAEVARTLRNVRARLERCEDQRDRLIRGEGSPGGPSWRPESDDRVQRADRWLDELDPQAQYGRTREDRTREAEDDDT
jgi:hypothetical protein